MSGVKRIAIASEKKSLVASERNNHKRGWFWRKIKSVLHERLKFIDEAGVTTVLTRLYGRAAPGVRVCEGVPKNYGESTSIISLMSLTGVEATMLVEGAVDTLCFDVFCDELLRPCLKSGDIVVLDNLAAHRASRIEETVKGCGGQVIWLPPYSPDFSPIEKMWSKLKTYLGKVKARTKEELERAVAEGLKLVTEKDCRGWFKHSGYQVA